MHLTGDLVLAVQMRTRINWLVDAAHGSDRLKYR